MRKMRVLTAAVAALVTLSFSQAAFADDPAGAAYAYSQCGPRQWVQKGFFSYHDCYVYYYTAYEGGYGDGG